MIGFVLLPNGQGLTMIFKLSIWGNDVKVRVNAEGLLTMLLKRWIMGSSFCFVFPKHLDHHLYGHSYFPRAPSYVWLLLSLFLIHLLFEVKIVWGKHLAGMCFAWGCLWKAHTNSDFPRGKGCDSGEGVPSMVATTWKLHAVTILEKFFYIHVQI